MLATSVPEAESFAREQRISLFPLLKHNPAVNLTRRQEEAAHQALATAQSDPLKFDDLLAGRELTELFAVGALHFGPNP